ncbi:hypothetical protein LSTR_LSTR005058 [Laodelphax striatellus]|uniref:Uncharacterized protein n=1 Tax=Laodelphax striatellus TaxID=195883 RepID=A0A482WT05_LAOST|nr:hypothetical protein LSTR_LSTR005058 [Laodelphax striatellus]
MENKIEENSSDSGRFSPSSTGDSNLPVDSLLDDDIYKSDNGSVTPEMCDRESNLESIAEKQEESSKVEQLSKTGTSTDKRTAMAKIDGRRKRSTYEKTEKELKSMKEEEERSYKRLMHLLGTSKFFTNFILKKMESSGVNLENKNQSPKTATSSSSDKDETATATSVRSSRRVLTENTSNQTNARTKRPAPGNADTKENLPKRKKKKLNIAISDLLTKEEVEEAHRQHMEKEAETIESEVDDSSPEETKVTSLGFTVPKNQPNLLEGGALRDYQMKGLEWLKVLFENGVSGILADEMGLGKTIQVISLICHLIEMGIPGPYLIVAPLSTLSNWLHEFEKFAPQVPVVLFYGTADERYALRKKLKTPTKISDQLLSVLPVVVTSYQVPLAESQVMSSINWQYIIVDEGHRIKNKETQLNRVLSACPSHNRLLLTGTPLQNNLTELWTLLHFLLPDMFNDITTFNTWLDLNNAGKEAEKILQKEREEQMVSTLHQILFPFVLRRTKSDIAIDIPPKKEVLVYCPMTDVQMELYEFVVTKFSENQHLPRFSVDNNLPSKRTPERSYRNFFREKDTFDLNDEDFASSRTPQIDATSRFKKPKRNDFFALSSLPKCKELTDRLNSVDSRVEFMEKIKMQMPHIALMHIVNHPYLVRMPVTCEKDKKYLFVNEDLIKVSGKFLVLEALLAKLKQRGHKVLLFSTSCMLLDLLEEFMVMQNHSFVRLDGQSRLMERKDGIHAFNTDPNLFVFLISTRAGGLGINLTGADTVILFNSDWNPMADLQAQDRAHRIGQTKPVVVYRLTVAGTIDEKVVKCGDNKKMMEKVVMKSGVFKLNEAPLLDLQELATLLNERKESAFVHSTPCGFSEEELEQLLDRSDMIENGKDLKVEIRPSNTLPESQPSPRKSPRQVTEQKTENKEIKIVVEKLAF